jgi:hypothetical protein
MTEQFLRLPKWAAILSSLGIFFLCGNSGSQQYVAEVPSGQPTAVTAIDVALEPDASMIQRAKAANAALLKVFPKGFALGPTRQPHVTILRQYVRTADLPKLYAAVAGVFKMTNVLGWKLKAYKYYYIPAGPIGLAGIVVEPTPELLRLQQDVIDAVAPFAVKTGSAAAFYTTPEEPNIDDFLIGYVATFVPKGTGKNFNPHVTTGLATQEYLKKLLAEPFATFTFSPVGASVYQLGDMGTARKKLESWELKP